MQMGKYVGSVKVSVFGAVLAVALAGCTEPTPTGKLPDPPSSAASSATDSSAAPTSTATATSAAPTTTYTPEEQSVIDQYKGYYEAFYTVPSMDAADIEAAFKSFVLPEVMNQVVTNLTDMASQGERPAGSVQFGVISLSISGSVANVTECRDSRTESIVSISDGSTRSQGEPGTLLKAELRLDANQVWMIWSAKGTKHGC